MKEYIVFGAIAVGLLGTAAIVGLESKNQFGSARTGDGRNASACPTSRSHIEASLQTTKADGMYYKVTRKSVRTPIRDVIFRMHGKDHARDSANNALEFAKDKLEKGATGAEKRYYQDTILRSKALLAIIDCLENEAPF